MMDFDWAYLFEISLTGIAGGGLYALAALAFVLVYKATRVVNIAIGEMLMAGGYLFFTFAAMWAMPLWLAIPAAVLASGVLGAVIERTVIRPLLGEPPISVFMVTVGLGSVLVGLVEMIWTADQRRLPDFMPSQPIMVGVSIPQFFFGMICILLFALNLGWLPIGGRMMPGETGLLNHLKYLILPASVLGISLTAGVMRYSRSSMLDTMNKDYIKTARAKGLPEWRVNLVHGFRVALTPVVVLIGFRLPTLIGGSVVIETIFQWPGIGNAFKTAVTGQNYPLVMMIALFSVLAVLVASFLVDILTAILDPRVKLE